jgi:hypothetical protein
LAIGNEVQIGYPASELTDVVRTTNSYPEEISVQNLQHSNANTIYKNSVRTSDAEELVLPAIS